MAELYSGFGIDDNLWTFDDLSHYEILDNGNVKLTFAKDVTYYEDKNDESSPCRWVIEIAEYEYSFDAKLIAGSHKTILEHEDEDYSGHNDLSESDFVIRYGAVDVEMIESWIELAEAKRNEQ